VTAEYQSKGIMETYTYDGGAGSLLKVSEAQKRGAKILCSHCGSELVVALDIDSANKQKVHPGIYCPVNQQHVCVMIELASVRRDFWEKFEARGVQQKAFKERED
jgi:hypothetical protein